MLLREAYERLEWGKPLAFERAALQRAQRHGDGPRQVGTSAHMLIEMYLDMERARRTGLGAVQPTEFVVVCTRLEVGRYLRRWLETIHGVLQLDVEPERVLFLPLDRMERHCPGRSWYSWAVYCDHTVKDESRQRNLGPYRYVRTVTWVGDGWEATDRDENVICRLTDRGRRDLADAATCPLTILRHERGTTYPAYQESEYLNASIRLREAFAR